ncbi:hypothetical protein R77555_02223 [Ralstonia mannitolilytica]|uniref:Peptide chain release factor 2 n=1 Tax=Ralstonia mannitolilytica TaxID=105219 RepID=A0AAJ4ZLL3_9RALS|nr:hypothetical protein LMG6866_01488 [Ralstonia mannitolilytica]CAJ0725941.1 hypothetical protein R77592_00819 [Ralstonia mannitolilytica]CAJ0727366.1 hypothetical protein R76706_01332 [Ralstonia mannitolilytica]CAJ0791619.1 hypothetical protein R77555_02223 [Ralstonia mannitolilytica]SUD88132.1 Uncharacterised protein [Ralstonia mannitolilytica]
MLTEARRSARWGAQISSKTRPLAGGAGGEPLDSAIISGFRPDFCTMEAERLNAIQNTLADLKSRADELRRYL